jgi:hypothetical protein
MGTRARLSCLALLTAAVLLVPAGASSAGVPSRDGGPRAADPPTRTIDVARLPRGHDARIDFLQDGVIHTSQGDLLPIGVPVTRDQSQLLGPTPQGWLVAVRKRYVSRVLVVRPGDRPLEIPHTRVKTFSDEAIGWLASRDGELLVSTSYSRGGSYRSVITLDGTGLGHNESTSFFHPLDAADGHVLTQLANLNARTKVVDWVPGTSRTFVANAAVAGFLRDDLVFVHTSGRLFGPTSLSAPELPVWGHAFIPRAISPDGATAVGLRISRSAFDDPAIIDIRRMADGRLLDSIATGQRITEENWEVGREHEQTVRWESDRSFVFQLEAPSGSVLVRCRLGGGCERASDYGGNISVPYETFLWW